MKMRLFLLCCMLFCSYLCSSQTDFRAGYIMQSDGKTLNGEIDYRSDKRMGSYCLFKSPNQTGEKQYTPNDIAGYRFKEGRYFVTKKIKDKKIFVEFLLQGRINLYFSVDDAGERYFIEKDSSGIIEIPYEEGIKYKSDGLRHSYETRAHIATLFKYMKDAPELRERIAAFGKPQQKPLISLVTDYHNAVCRDSSCITYGKILPSIRLDGEVIGGLAVIDDPLFNKSGTSLEFGVLGRISFPYATEKWFLRTGVLFGEYNFFVRQANIKYVSSNIKVPLQLQYVYPRGVIRPTVALGINAYNGPLHILPAFKVGADIQIQKSIFLTLAYDMDDATKGGRVGIVYKVRKP
jgi:hypothetical protein